MSPLFTKINIMLYRRRSTNFLLSDFCPVELLSAVSSLWVHHIPSMKDYERSRTHNIYPNVTTSSISNWNWPAACCSLDSCFNGQYNTVHCSVARHDFTGLDCAQRPAVLKWPKTYIWQIIFFIQAAGDVLQPEVYSIL